MRILLWWCVFALLGCPEALPESKPQKNSPQTAPASSAIDEILAELKAHPARLSASPGSTFDPAGRFADVSRDLRASHVNDLVTVIISDHANNVSVIAWSLEALPDEFALGGRLAELEVEFRAESRHGERIAVLVQREPGEAPAFRHTLVREGDGREIARVRSVWALPAR